MLNLTMIFHCHQPVGNFDSVFEMALKKCYLPMLKLLKSHPLIKCGLHFSGPLLEWIETNTPEHLDFMASMAENGQVEFLSGGFFEPLLATIPVRDIKGQVEMMNDFISRKFGQAPTGFWLTERVWDPNLPLTLEGTGMKYTVVDDTHLCYAGLGEHEIYGRYVTEKEGRTMSLLATPMEMRYFIPFKPVDDVINHLKWLNDQGRCLVVYGDDGEKFGVWPGTYEWVIKQGWLEKFFQSVQENRDWLEMILPGKVIETSIPLGRVYLPQASYEEMTEWALAPSQSEQLEDIITVLKNEGRWEEWRPFVRGGIWDNFLIKYDESNRMHKKMLFLSEKVGEDLKAREFLWKAQCNCAYWHGVFGGLYLGHLRRAIHDNLIRAQKSIIEGSEDMPVLFQVDIDKDGNDELLIWNRELSLGIDPGRGGGLFEVCHIPLEINLSDVLTRRHEAYHRHINDMPQTSVPQEEEGISSIHNMGNPGDGNFRSLLIYDRYTRTSLLDHFLSDDTSIEDYIVNNYTELGDFVQAEYQIERTHLSTNDAGVEFSRTGIVEDTLVSVKKGIRVNNSGSVFVDYEFEGVADKNLSCLYGCEFNLNLFSDKDKGRYCYIPETGSRIEISESREKVGISQFELVNKADRITAAFRFSEPVIAWVFPLITVSKSEQGFEASYQGTSLLFLYPIELPMGQKIHFQIRLRLFELS